jgi:hypothetical protein
LLYLSFHHHIILVKCKESSLLQKLREEFHFFESIIDPGPHTIIDLEFGPSPELPSMVAHKIMENAIIYRLGEIQYLDYFGEALTIRNDSEHTFKIYSQSYERLYELAFLTIHSILGQNLDKRGLCRIHAAAISLDNVNAIIMLPSKGGKSTLVKHVLSNEDVKIISDDMPLCSLAGKIFPFTSKLSFDEIPKDGPLSHLRWNEFKRFRYPIKWTASLSQLKDRLDQTPMENKNILIAGYRLSRGDSIMSPVSKFQMIKPILEHMIVGIGLPQIVEIFLGFEWRDILKLSHHAALRTICAVNLIRRSQCYYFYMGQDLQKNSQLILELMHDHKNS